MIIKRNGEIKSMGVANGNLQILRTDKSECASTTPDFYSIKHVCAVAAKKERDVETIDLQGFPYKLRHEKIRNLSLLS